MSELAPRPPMPDRIDRQREWLTLFGIGNVIEPLALAVTIVFWAVFAGGFAL